MIDYLREVKEIVAKLKLLGLDNEAAQISDALSGFSGTEIAMALRLVMSKLMETNNSSIPSDIQAGMRSISIQLATFLDE